MGNHAERAGKQSFPSNEIVELARPPRRTGVDLLSRVMFTFQDRPATLSLGDGAGSSIDSEKSDAQTDLTLIASRDGSGEIVFTLEYSKEAFSEAVVCEMAKSLTRLAKGIGRDPDAPLDVLPLLDEAESKKRLMEHSGIQFEGLGSVSLTELLVRRVKLEADRVAISYMGQSVTYGSLWEKVAGLALTLKAAGVKKGDRVVVLLSRSVNCVVAMCAVAQLGGIFSIVDRRWPVQRMLSAIKRVASAVVVSDSWIEAQSSLLASLAEAEVATVLIDGPNEPGQLSAGEQSAASSEDPLYILFTSGSTGSRRPRQLHKGSSPD